MKPNTFFLLIILVAIVACSACTSGGKSPSHTLHTYCEGFSLTCLHGGTCGEAQLGTNQFRDTCTCPAAYEGTTCENRVRDKFLGRYVGIMYQQYPGAATASSFPDTVTIVAGSDETKAIVQHLYVFLSASPYVPAHYDTIVCDANYGTLTSHGANLKFTDAANTQLYFQGPGALAFGELAYSWFEGIRH